MATTTNKVLAWVYDDGGRSKYFKAQKVGDCVTRAIAIASGRDYKEVYDELFAMAGKSPRDGVSKHIIRKYMQAHGYEWHATMAFGTGVTNHLRENEVPMHGAIVCSCSGHLTAVIDGVVHDTYDPARDGGRAVYGYWIVKPAGGTPDGDKPAKQETPAPETLETIKPTNRRGNEFPTSENDTYKFYYTGIASEADELEAKLKAQGFDAQKDFSTRGWFVRVRKNPKQGKPEPKQYEPLTTLPNVYIIKERHKVTSGRFAGGYTETKKLYSLKEHHGDNSEYWYECNGKEYHLTSAATRQRARADLLAKLNHIFEKMQEYNNKTEFAAYKVSVKYA